MPLVDMPLEQLQQYEGRNPRPADFDAYWERALDELQSVKDKLELIPSTFQTPQADCFDLFFTGVRGARIHAKYLRPKVTDGPQPVILQFHGYTGDSGDWQEKLAYVSLGYSVLALDCRGQGGASEDTGGVKGTTHNGHFIRGLDDQPDNLLFRHIYLDTVQLARIAFELPGADPDKVYAMGGSQGGALTIACAALEPRVKKLAAVHPFLCDYRRVWEMDLDRDAYQELNTFFRKFDPLHEREDEIFERLGYIDIQHLAARIQGEVLFTVSMMDTVCPPSTQFAAYNKITAPKELVIYPDFGHEFLPGNADRTMQFFLKK